MFVQLRLKEKCVINQDTNSFMQSKARIKGDGGGDLQRMSRAKEEQACRATRFSTKHRPPCGLASVCYHFVVTINIISWGFIRGNVTWDHVWGIQWFFEKKNMQWRLSPMVDLVVTELWSGGGLVWTCGRLVLWWWTCVVDLCSGGGLGRNRISVVLWRDIGDRYGRGGG